MMMKSTCRDWEFNILLQVKSATQTKYIYTLWKNFSVVEVEIVKTSRTKVVNPHQRSSFWQKKTVCFIFIKNLYAVCWEYWLQITQLPTPHTSWAHGSLLVVRNPMVWRAGGGVQWRRLARSEAGRWQQVRRGWDGGAEKGKRAFWGISARWYHAERQKNLAATAFSSSKSFLILLGWIARWKIKTHLILFLAVYKHSGITNSGLFQIEKKPESNQSKMQFTLLQLMCTVHIITYHSANKGSDSVAE